MKRWIKLPPKQILVPGSFTDATGQDFEVPADEVPLFFRDTLELIRDGYRICGWPSHGMDDTTRRLCGWGDLELRVAPYYHPPSRTWKTGPCIYARAVARTPAAARVLRENDTSPVLAWGYPWAGKSYGHVITRIDSVGQGAVPTTPFQVAASAALGARKIAVASAASKGKPIMDEQLIELLTSIMGGEGEDAAKMRAALGASLKSVGAMAEGEDALSALKGVLTAYKGKAAEAPPTEEPIPAAEGDELPAGAAEETDDVMEELSELAEASEEEELMGEMEAPAAAPAPARAAAGAAKPGAKKVALDPVRLIFEEKLARMVRTAKALTLKGNGKPMSKAVADRAVAKFGTFYGVLGPRGAIEEARQVLASEVKIARLSAVAGQAAGAKPATRPTKAPTAFVPPTGDKNPIVNPPSRD